MVPAAVRGVIVALPECEGRGPRWRELRSTEVLRQCGFATLLLDPRPAYDLGVERIAGRVLRATKALDEVEAVRDLCVGYFGVGENAASVLIAAARAPRRVTAVVSECAHPELLGPILLLVRSATLLITRPEAVAGLDARATTLEPLKRRNRLEVIHDEGLVGAARLERQTELAALWFAGHLRSKTAYPG